MVTALNVSSLDTDAAISFIGGGALALTGYSVAGGSDVNGDGFTDIVIGANAANSNAGAVYVVFGSASGFANIADLSALGSAGLTINGGANDRIGLSVSLPGDVNDDGVDDILIGAGANSFSGGTGPGEAYLIFGGNSLPTTLSVDGLGANGLTLTGPANQATRVSGAGDVDNDGIPDILVSSPYSSNTYLVYGDGALGAVINLTAGPSFPGIQGVSLAGGGDINGDGIDDFLIGHDYGTPVVFGSTTRFTNNTDLSVIGTTGYRLTTPDSGQFLGTDVAFLGDINGDGNEDFAVFAGRGDTPNGPDNGGAFIMYGGTNVSGDVPISNIGNAGFIIHNAFLGGVASAGDFNGDGLNDILFAYDNGNQVYVIFGRQGGFGGDVRVNELTDDQAVLLVGPVGQTQVGISSDILGESMAALGDINNDGFDDILLGAPGNATNPGGGAFIIFGFSNAPLTLNGGNDADTLNGGVGDDTIAGGGGHDLLIAGGGNDQVSGDDGDDRAYGQSGNDTVSGGEGDDSLFGNLGDDEITGGPNNDMIRAHVGGDLVTGDAGDDNLFGGGGDDTMTGGAGNDTLGGNSGADMVSGNDGNDTVRGQAGNDTLNGNDGDDLVIGMQGNDMLFGGAGNDTLIGGEANDTLTGGAGVDAFVFAATQGADVIADFEDGTDVISLVGVANFAALTIVDIADGARITFEATPTTAIIVTGINANQLTAADFFFS